jgi:hypothetical protein
VTLETGESAVRPTTSAITWANRWDHFLARWAVNRSGHRVAPGLYALGNPTADSPVFVTANYTLSFDALRSALADVNGYILVLDTQGVNVWCAAGKGTFGTDELIHQIEATGLHNVVRHRILILPQLGAPGVAAHEVAKRTKFKVEYGPVRAADLIEYLKTRQAAPEMRRVRFALRDRLILIPVEFVAVLLPMLLAAGVAFFIGGLATSVAVIVAILAGTILFPIALPWLPTHDFASKGFILGGIVMLPFALAVFLGNPDAALWRRVAGALTYWLSFPAITAFLALNFTGATTFTSRSGVRREMFAYIPIMAWTFGVGIALTIGLAVTRMLGGA